ncbi:STAS domain-containing protein [Conexibacter woesei]|uniref:STAS domain-containing protein n=1 Tax=Conexibacter woesei TaxID=191495 RepID=UPI0004012DD8|nr:STAS domain-containing protein [Conexibacter woesei]
MSFAEPRFRTHERVIDPTTSVIEVGGEIHVSTAPELTQALNAAIDGGRTRLVLDLGGVMFIDSTGLAILLSALRRVDALAVVCTNPTVLRLFEITRLDETFAIHDAVEPALRALAAA